MWNRTPAMPGEANDPLPDNRRLLRILLISCLLLTIPLAIVYLLSPKAFQFLTHKSTDIILSGSKTPQSSPEVVIVAIDERSLEKYGQWPWPRYRIAQLLDTLEDSGAASIGIDIIFAEPDRTSPVILQKTLKQDFGYLLDTSNIPSHLLDHDIYLANILKDGPYILGYKFLFDAIGKNHREHNLHPVSVSQRVKEGLPEPAMIFHQAKGVICNYEILVKAARSSGFLNGNPDIDGVLRRLPLLVEFKEKIYPSFALAILMQVKRQNLLIRQEDDLHFTRLSLENIDIPTDGQGNFLLGPATPTQKDHISAVDVLEGKAVSTAFQDKIVLVGSTASGLTQLFPSPGAPAVSLLDIHSHAIRSLLAAHFTIRTSAFPICEAMTSVFLCVLLALATYYLPTIWALGFCLLAACFSWILAGIVYKSSGLLFSPFLPTISLLLSTGIFVSLKFRHFQVHAKTETKNTLLLLQTNEASLQSILNAIPDIIYRLDKDAQFTFISPKITQYMISPTELIGRSIFDFIFSEDLEKARYTINERRVDERATGDLQLKLLFNKEKDQPQENYRFFSISAEGIYRNNTVGPENFLGTQGIMRDITNRKQLENRLLQAQKLEVVGNLAAGIAHDLNNILSGLVSYPDLLLMEIPREDPLHGKISVIQKSGKKAAAIVQDLLTLARRSVDISHVCNMNTIINDYLDSVEFQRIKTRYPKITIETDLQENLFNIKGSAVHLSKVIMNLIHNSMEAMPAGGNIVISTGNTYVDTHLDGYEQIPEGEYSCASISDSGVGIPAGDLRNIFEPFYTKKSMAKSGTGLGMTVIWATIKDHEGYIDLDSKEGMGTTVTMYLPTTRTEPAAMQQRIVLDDYLGTESILIIDDIPEQLDIAQNMLTKLGYKVLTASSGENGLAVAKKQPIDLIILDMIMPPGLDGLETYEQISRLYPTQKAIITSGFSESDRVKELQRLGVTNYVQKPFTMETLGVAVRNELDKDNKQSPSPN